MSHAEPSPTGAGPAPAAPPWWVRLLAPVALRLPAGNYRLARRLPRPARPFRWQATAAFGGFRFECDLRDALCREICWCGAYAPGESRLIAACLPRDGTFVDVGANWGYFSLLGALRVGPNGRVLSLEPDPRLFGWLGRNLRINGFGHAAAVQVAAAAGAGALTLRGFDPAGGNFGLSRLAPADGSLAGPEFAVRGESLDRLLAERQIGAVDLLKMDVEGAERLALGGLEESLGARRVRRLALELHPRELTEYGSSPAAVFDLLEAHAYRGFAFSPGGDRLSDRVLPELTPFDRSRPLPPWPHLLWLAPGEPPPTALGEPG